MAKEKLKRYNAPYGLLKYPWIVKPNTKFNPDGVFQCKLVLPQDKAKGLIELINGATDTYFNEVYNSTKKKDQGKLFKKYPYNAEYDSEEVETGNIEFKFKCAKRVTTTDGKEYTFKVNVFDKYNAPIPEDTFIATGSKGIINFSMRNYFVVATGMVGVTLQLNAVQVRELITGGATAEAFGFEAEEGEEEVPPFDKGEDDF